MKRTIDIIGSAIVLIFLSPIILCTYMLVLFDVGAPVIFQQIRPGFLGKPFTMMKFRTMRNIRNNDANQISDHVRLTRIGKFLRSFSLDELPGLWNVLNGDMSLVGPRPLLMEYLSLYTPEQARRHEVRPGITGWAQVNGRNALLWEEKFALDIWYIDNQSLWLDARILWLTVIKVIRRDGISAEGEVTMPRFKGTLQND